MNATALPDFLSSLLESRRVDPDFNPSEADIEMVAKLLARAATTPITYHEGNGNAKFQKWILAIVAGLVVVGIPALISGEIYNSSRIAILETKVDMMILALRK